MRTSRFAGLVILAISLPFATGCAGEGTASPGLEATIDTIGGIEHLHYPETGATTLPWRFDTVAVIGGYTIEDPNYQFGRLGPFSLTSDTADNLYVLDGQGKRILAYRPTGEFIGTWGREGEGPGEIGAWGGMLAMGPGDTLWLADGANQRITLFPTDAGETISIPIREGTSRFGGRLSVVPGGAISLMSSFSFGSGEDEPAPPRPLVHINRDGTMADTLWKVPPAETDLVTISMGNRSLSAMLSRVFSPRFSYGRFSDGRLVLHEKAQYDLRILASDGTVQHVIQRNPLPRATTDEDRQRTIDEMLNPPNGDVSDIQKKVAQQQHFSEIIPRINKLVVDHADRIWVGISETLPNKSERLDIYSRDGQLLGELHDVELPQLFFGDGYAALITKDDLDVEQIIILKLVETM